MRDIMTLLPRLAQSDANILILGESGTGKELIARAIHHMSPRSRRRFVAVNCAAMPEALLESELFGHEKGSFTGATSFHRGLIQEADGGTLFLDEIGDMPMPLQAKLLRVLQDKAIRPVGSTEIKPIDFRLIAATHRDLKHAAKTGEFREDLYYRLSVVPISIPPLRQRTEDIPALVSWFAELHSKRHGIPKPQFSPDAIKEIMKRPWHGNARELENLIERLIILKGQKDVITADDIPFPDAEDIESDRVDFTFHGRLPTVAKLIEQYIKYVYKEVGHHQGRASAILGLSRRTLYRKLRAYARAERAQQEAEEALH